MDSLLIFFFFCIGAVMVYLARLRLRAVKAAEVIVQRQFEPIDQSVVDDGFSFYDGDALQRYTTIVRRIRQQYGHEGFKVGHMSWLIHVMENPQIDVHSVEIPSFVQRL